MTVESEYPCQKVYSKLPDSARTNPKLIDYIVATKIPETNVDENCFYRNLHEGKTVVTLLLHLI